MRGWLWSELLQNVMYQVSFCNVFLKKLATLLELFVSDFIFKSITINGDDEQLWCKNVQIFNQTI